MLDHMDIYKARLGDFIEEAKSEYGYVETDPSSRYGRFKEVLGKGAMKTVYKAFDQVRGMEVAWSQIKLNDVFRSPEELQRLYSEVHLLSTLDHDSIIHLYTSWIDVDQRTFNFITEMLTSGTLREYRQRYKQVDIRAVKNWARQILHGLVYLHGHDPPVIHRDLKCDNIFVNGHLGQVKIGDLGFAAILRSSCHAHSVIGTPEFMAPELYEEEYDELVDIYSFGMCVLEMLTSEYPYSECSNPAQIYKKVTSGKLPEAFHRIHDLEARRFVGKCLETASKRLPARELLLDPFLAPDEEEEMLPNINQKPKIKNHKPNANDIGFDTSRYVWPLINPTWSTDMTITGKMNPEDDTIYLKVQIADKYGITRNIYFPFDIVSDTPIDVATEMVKELEINDREPIEIAEVIQKEISALVPEWKDWDPPHNINDPADFHCFSYVDDDDENDGSHHPFYSFSSCSSSQASLSGLLPPSGTHFTHGDYNHDMSYGSDGLQDQDDDASSQSSLYSGKYSNINYQSAGSEQDCDLVGPSSSSSKREMIHHPPAAAHQILKTIPKCTTRFCPETTGTGHLQNKQQQQAGKVLGDFDQEAAAAVAAASSSKGIINSRMTVQNSSSSSRRLTRMKSLVDVRSQLLHRSLVEEVNKRRLFKTVGAVENIGFQSPIDPCSGKASSQLPRGVGWAVNNKGSTGPRSNNGKTK